MAKIKIDDATNKQIDYAAAIAQGFDIKINRNDVYVPVSIPNSKQQFTRYHPTTDQSQCGELIDKFRISTNASILNDEVWTAQVKFKRLVTDKSRLIAAVKAFLYSVHPDGMIGVI
jgi:hypothetical protein